MKKAKSIIKSNERSSYWILIGMGILFCLISTPVLLNLPKEVSQGNYGIFVALIFPLSGLGMLLGGWKMRQKFFKFGATPLKPSPIIGQVGGQIGGHIEIDQPWHKRDLDITLSCIHTYSTGSGKNSSTRSDILWQTVDKPVDKPNSPDNSTTRLEFCFDVPAGKPTQEQHSGRGNISWTVAVEGTINNIDFSRSWTIPVEVGNKQSAIVIPDSHKEATYLAKRKQAEASIQHQIHTERTDHGVDIVSDQGRNKNMSWGLILFGSVFSLTGCFLFYQAYQGDSMLWVMAPIFFSIGALIFAFGIFLLGRKLECKIIGDQVHTRRSFFGRVVYTRQGKLTSPEQLILKTSMTSTSNGKRTEYMAIYAKVPVNTANGTISKELKIVEGIESKAAGEAMKRTLTDAILENSYDLRGELGIGL